MPKPMQQASKTKVVIVSGYFNPLHKGHIEYFHNAKRHGDKLVVIVNSDFQRALKGSKEFMSEQERLLIVENLRVVDHAVLSIDPDRTVCKTLEYLYKRVCPMLYRNYELAFANGGDQNNDTIPEKPVCQELGIRLIDGLGEKIQSSSWLLESDD
jgi:cytidyltransferase-like protein